MVPAHVDDLVLVVHEVDDQMRADGVELARVGALEPGQMAGHLDDHDLEAEAQPEARDLALAGELDGVDLPLDAALAEARRG